MHASLLGVLGSPHDACLCFASFTTGHEACGEELMEMRDFLKSCFSKAAGKL